MQESSTVALGSGELELPDSPGWVMYAYTTAAGSATEERVKLVGILAATMSTSHADTRD